jgi:hypothetical protein
LLDQDCTDPVLEVLALEIELAVLNVTSDRLDWLDRLDRLDGLVAVLAVEGLLQLLTLERLTLDTLDCEAVLGEEAVLSDAMGYIAGLEGRIPVTLEWQSIAGRTLPAQLPPQPGCQGARPL